MRNEPKIPAILHILWQAFCRILKNLSETCNPVFLFKGKGLCLQPQPCWLHHLCCQHSHGYLAADLNKSLLFNIKVIYWLWKEPILAAMREEKELAVAVPSSPTCSHDEAGPEQHLLPLHCSLNFHLLLISTTNISEKKNFWVYCTKTVFHHTPMKINYWNERNCSPVYWMLDSIQWLYLLSERISSVTFFPVNLCLFPILKLRVFRSRLSLREQ